MLQCYSSKVLMSQIMCYLKVRQILTCSKIQRHCLNEKIVYQLGIVCSYLYLLETLMGKQYAFQNTEPLLGSPFLLVFWVYKLQGSDTSFPNSHCQMLWKSSRITFFLMVQGIEMMLFFVTFCEEIYRLVYLDLLSWSFV